MPHCVCVRRHSQNISLLTVLTLGWSSVALHPYYCRKHIRHLQSRLVGISGHRLSMSDALGLTTAEILEGEVCHRLMCRSGWCIYGTYRRMVSEEEKEVHRWVKLWKGTWSQYQVYLRNWINKPIFVYLSTLKKMNQLIIESKLFSERVILNLMHEF